MVRIRSLARWILRRQESAYANADANGSPSTLVCLCMGLGWRVGGGGGAHKYNNTLLFNWSFSDVMEVGFIEDTQALMG